MTLADQCVLKDNWADAVHPPVDPVPNGIIMASPGYFCDVNAQILHNTEHVEQ